jgi:hypothetical protein
MQLDLMKTILCKYKLRDNYQLCYINKRLDLTDDSLRDITQLPKILISHRDQNRCRLCKTRLVMRQKLCRLLDYLLQWPYLPIYTLVVGVCIIRDTRVLIQSGYKIITYHDYNLSFLIKFIFLN